MKTILIAHNFSEVSFAYMSYHLAHSLADKGFRVIFISHQPYFEEEVIIPKEKGELIVCSWSSRNRPTSLKDFKLFFKIFIKYKPEIIIGHFVGANISAVVSKLSSFFKVRTYVYYHTLSQQNLLDSKRTSLKQSIYKLRKKIFYYFFVDYLIFPSQMAKKDAIAYFNISPKKTHVVLNAIPDRCKEQKKNASQKIIVSYLGRLEPSKNVLLLIESFLEFEKTNKTQQVILRIAGAGREAEKIKNASEKYDTIKFMGKLEYSLVDNYIKESHYVIIPSFIDNLPTVGIESLMNYVPLLISTKTGLAEYCEDNYDAYTFEPTKKGIMDVFQKITKFKEHQSSMCFNAREKYIKMFGMLAYEESINHIINNG